MENIINKSMDLEDFNEEKLSMLCKDIIALEDDFSKDGFIVSSWYGNIQIIKFYDKLEKLNRGYHYKAILPKRYDKKFPSFLIWEIYNVFYGLNLKKGDIVLDIGGACSLFSFFLASKGIEVVAIDKNELLVDEANRIAKAKKLNYNAVNMDAEEYVKTCNRKFDYITSICVFEHIALEKRKRIMLNLDKILSPKGKVAMTFDYKNPSKFVQINNNRDIHDQFGCNPNFIFMGNDEFYV